MQTHYISGLSAALDFTVGVDEFMVRNDISQSLTSFQKQPPRLPLQRTAPWPMWQRNSLHMAASPFIGPRNQTRKLSMLFKSASGIQGSPVIDNQFNVYFGSNDKYLHKVAINMSQTSFPAKSKISSTPIIDDLNRLYFGCISGSVYALDANTLTTLWTVTLGGGIYSSPMIGINRNIIFTGGMLFSCLM